MLYKNANIWAYQTFVWNTQKMYLQTSCKLISMQNVSKFRLPISKVSLVPANLKVISISKIKIV